MFDTPTVRWHFRFAHPADAVSLRELALRTSIDTFAAHNDPANFEKYLETTHSPAVFERELADPRSRTLLAEHAGRMIAYARLRWGRAPDCVGDPDALEIDKFYIDRPFHGSGLAGEMMQQCLDLAHQQGRTTIFLGVWEHNQRAIAFYTRKWGFRRCGEHVFVVGDDPQIDWWMARLVCGNPDAGGYDANGT